MPGPETSPIQLDRLVENPQVENPAGHPAPVDNPRRRLARSSYRLGMRVPITVTTTGGVQQDVVVEASTSYHGDELADALTRALHLDPGSSLWIGAEELGSRHRLGFPPLLAGTTLLARSRPPAPRRAPDVGSSPLRLAVTAGRDAGRDLDLRHGRYTVGRGSGCDLALDDPAASRAHAVVTSDESGVHVQDLDVTNRSTINGTVIPTEGQRLTTDDVLVVGGHRLELVAPEERPMRTTALGDGTLSVSPAPSPGPPESDVVVAFPLPPVAPRPRRLPWAMLLLPLVIAGVLAVFLGPRMLLFGLFSPLLILGSALSERFGSRADLREQQRRWARDTGAARRRLDDTLAAERRAWMHTHPGPFDLRRVATVPTERLWERRDGRATPLQLRVGLGEITARTRAHLQGAVPERVPLPAAPVVLDLDDHPVVGLVGEMPATGRAARWLVGQAVALHPPSELAVLMLDEPSWIGSLRHAPHVRTIDLSDLPGLTAHPENAPARPALLVVTEDPVRWRDDPRWRDLLTGGSERPVRILMSSTSGDELPHECSTTVHLDECQAVIRSGPSATTAAVDGVDDAWAEQVGRALAPLRDATPGATAALPTTIRLDDLIKGPADGSGDAPARRAAQGLGAVIGATTAGPLCVDLVADGPHALVGGTTGSGKSELLQSWVASLAVSHGPDLLNFVLVDYKGGAAFSGCAGLPHTVGMLTDLEPAETRRALRSLQAEVRRRERLLAAARCSDIDGFRSQGGVLPRLVLVIDEFRALAEEQPEALKELVHLAAVGRSLGLHLILATQRPSGVITPEIRANVNLRIALRVRDRLDSEDLIGSGEAARLPEGAPGRALLRTGDDAPTTFQAAYVGGRATAESGLVIHTDETPGELSLPGRGPTDLQAVVARVQESWARSGASPPHRPWQPPLPSTVTDDQLPSSAPGRIVWGLMDLPDEQRRGALTWRSADGHLLILGGPGTGRTTAACGLATRASSERSCDVEVHALVPPGPMAERLARTPGMGSVVDPADRSATRRLLSRMGHEVRDRRGRLSGTSPASFDDRADVHGSGCLTPPSLLLVVDGWSHVTDERDPSGHERALELERLARDGLAVGVRLVVTGGRDLASSRLASIVGRRLVLHMPDRYDAISAGLRPDETVERPVPGRGIMLPDRSLVQVAPPPADRDVPYDVTVRPSWRIVDLPQLVTLSHLTRDEPGLVVPDRTRVVLGHSGEEGLAATLPLDAHGTWCVLGPRRAGRTTALHVVADQLRSAGRPIVQVVSPSGKHLTGLPSLGPDDVDALVAHVQRHDTGVVLVDDIEELDGTPVRDALHSLIAHCARSGVLMLASSTTHAAAGVRGLAPTACRARAGLLLQPHNRTDGDPLGVRVPPTERVPGRGYLVAHGETTEVQVALPHRLATDAA